MTHLSDYTYLDRLVCNILALIWILYRIQSQVGAREALSIRRIRKGELRPLITILLLVSNLLAVIYDVIVAGIKYREGFAVVGSAVVSKPKEFWTAEDLRILPISDSIIDFSFAFMTSALFLFQATWNFIVQSYIKRPFMNSMEFHLYLVYSSLSFVTYALLQFLYLSDKTQSTIIPQMFFCSEGFVLVAFTIINHVRLNRTLQEIEKTSRARKRLEVCMKLNVYLGIFISMMAVPLSIINIDMLTVVVIAKNKLASDILMKFFNLGFPGTFIFLCMALYPSYEHTACGCSGNRRYTARQCVDSAETSDPSMTGSKGTKLEQV
ncbi:hypothetical protein K7432_006350 [Basidiobolus ranarum]|uniref:Uncharacterized protein n=1 Tax=Basidiobolus ranarum TaxID=34480 RepID=A0ABR2W1S3_9FUNG